jgi:hypothetical protein
MKCEYCKKDFLEYKGRKKYCDFDCRNKGMLGKKHSEETIKKMSESKKGYIPVNIFKKGKDHPFYKKDRTKVNPRWSAEYSEWRRKVFERDHYKCVKCGIGQEEGVLLDADHIVPFAHDQNKQFDVKNGRVLCRQCHIKEPTWGMKSGKYKRLL